MKRKPMKREEMKREKKKKKKKKTKTKTKTKMKRKVGKSIWIEYYCDVLSI